MNHTYQHWQLHIDSEQIAWLTLDKKGVSTNTIDHDVLNELNEILDHVKTEKGLLGLVLTSAKTNFVAGADLHYLAQLTDEQAIESFIRQGQNVFAKLAKLSIRTVALIKGFALGGGLELALACDYRIGCKDETTCFGLPEIKIGIQPAWGGTIRLPERIGILTAMNYILTGKMIRASQAKRLGLIDALVPERQLLRAARAFIESPIKRTHRWITFTNKILNNKWIRQGVSRYLRTQVSKKANPSHYPAPGMIIGNWERYGIYHPQAWQAEIEGVARLFKVNDTARHLLRVFFLQERLKSFSKKNACTWTQIHCIGAGTMGAGMAAWCALQGMRVTLHDPNRAAIAQAMASAHKLFKKHLKKPHLIQSAMDRLTPDFSGEGVKRADLIIEAAPEDLAIKRALFKAIEQQAKPEAVLATNTSSIPLDAINKVLENPQRLVGIHFFNPVSKMPLVEVVKGEQTSTSVYEQAMAFVGRIKRLPLPVKSAPGFLVNRILMPYLLEAMMLAEEGVPLSQIDAAAVEFGMPVGPIELADRVGLDVCLSVAQNLSQYFGVSIPKQLTALVQANHLGDKTKQGFYRYEKGKKQPSKARSGAGTTIDNREISERLIFIMLKEAMRCLDEKIVEDSDLLDASMIFGTGFAPFRGGLMHYAKTLGERRLKTSMKECHERYGERFAVTSQ